jgi:hypothetical protein
MWTGRWLAVLAAGAILAFAVTADIPVFNVHIAGYVIMAIAVLGLLLPARDTRWSRLPGMGRGRRRAAREIEQPRSRTYVLRSPATSDNETGPE